VKDKGANLNTLTTTITNIVSCVPLVLLQPYVVICYGHAMFKCYQYATNDLKVFNGMKEVSILKFNLFYIILSLGLKKKEMVDKNGLGLANMQVVKGRNF
jgi:hypothetical protein